ncbi:hypothetical protein Cal7507_2645 [Calothrix sp. PCC 7507]|nr:hypothetical protein Cal7507_2645 [Calothrix sp. PCC 7507]
MIAFAFHVRAKSELFVCPHTYKAYLLNSANEKGSEVS